MNAKIIAAANLVCVSRYEFLFQELDPVFYHIYPAKLSADLKVGLHHASRTIVGGSRLS